MASGRCTGPEASGKYRQPEAKRPPRPFRRREALRTITADAQREWTLSAIDFSSTVAPCVCFRTAVGACSGITARVCAKAAVTPESTITAAITNTCARVGACVDPQSPHVHGTRLATHPTDQPAGGCHQRTQTWVHPPRGETKARAIECYTEGAADGDTRRQQPDIESPALSRLPVGEGVRSDDDVTIPVTVDVSCRCDGPTEPRTGLVRLGRPRGGRGEARRGSPTTPSPARGWPSLSPKAYRRRPTPVGALPTLFETPCRQRLKPLPPPRRQRQLHRRPIKGPRPHGPGNRCRPIDGRYLL
jgi:hypothetical protein